MNLFKIYTENEKERIFDETNIKIENKEYSKDERIKLANIITDSIMNISSKNNAIRDKLAEFNPIIEKLRV